MATTTQTATAEGPASERTITGQIPAAARLGRPDGSGGNNNPMKSTWRYSKDRKEWTFHHYLYHYLGINPTDLDREVPVHQKTDKMGYVPAWQAHKWILVHALWPILIHHFYATWAGKNMHPVAAFIFYTVAFKANAIHELNLLRNLGHKHGFLDGDKHERDQVPDQDVHSVFHSLSSTATFRPLLGVFFAYSRTMTPAQWNPLWLPVLIGLYPTTLDFWFYWYHRCMHEFDGLWKHHRKHHMTKHPNPLLSLYADTEQEIFDIAGIPLLTYFTIRYVFRIPVSYYDFWILNQYIVFTELWGHSGTRIFITPPTTATPLLKFFDAELQTEDHDLHHRKGWKSSHNYGKQTLLWDKIFGTALPRIEQVDENVDWSAPQPLNLW